MTQHLDMDHISINTGTTQNITEDNTLDDDTTPERITIEDINITTDMNTSQMAIPAQQQQNDDVPTHGYNLRKTSNQEGKKSVHGTNRTNHRSGRLCNTTSQTTCLCDIYTDECQTRSD
jgi:hypothetical protein